jgi:hypothetical protein
MEKKLLDFVGAIFSDNNKVMLQNLVGVFAFIYIIIIAIGNQFFDKNIKEFIFDGIFWIVIGCLGVGAAIEGIKNFSKTPPKNEEKPEEKDQNNG